MKKFLASTLILLSNIVLTLVAGSALAQEPPLRFVHALQQAGYGDMAVEYLNLLAKRPNLPPEVRDVWELEMSKSLKAAADSAFDEKEYERLIGESQQHLAKFLKEKPDHPAAADALIAWGESLMRRVQDVLRAAKFADAKDKAQHEKLIADARVDLTSAREKFDQAKAKFKKRLDDLPPPSNLPGKKADRDEVIEARTQAEGDIQEAEFHLAWVDYCTAQTHPEKTPERTAATQQAGKAFDDIFQRSRTSSAGLTRTGLYAHLWHGKTAEELGDPGLALDIYDEVLANAPDLNERAPATGLEPLFTQAEYFRLLILAKQKPALFFSEAKAWLLQSRRLRHTDGYQAISLEMAKAKLVPDPKATTSEKTRHASEALQILIDMSKTRSQYQREAILLRREVMKARGQSEFDVKTFEEAVALGDAAMSGSQWEQARSAYNKALEIADKRKRKDPAGIEAVHEALARAEYQTARELFDKGKLSECIDMVRSTVFDDPEKKTVRKQSEAAAQAAALAVVAALNLYVDAPDDKKPAALDKLSGLAKFVETNWPDRPEADDARMARGQAKLVAHQVRDAVEIFDRVNPKSDRYPLAMYRAGQNYAALYWMEKKKLPQSRNAQQMAADRGKAIERLEASLAVLHKAIEPGKPLPKHFVDSQLLLAEIRLEAGEMKQAAALYQPLVEALKAEKPKTFDETTLRIFLGAVRAYAALGELEKAGDASALLIALGPDTPEVNAAITRFARLLDLERKKAVAAVTELEQSTKVAELNAARARLASIEKLLGAMLVKLAGRQHLSLAETVFVGDALNNVGMTDEASGQYQNILKRAEADPDFAMTAAKALTRVRAQLVGILRKQGKFEEALAQAERLIKDNPGALEPLMEKGRILEGWAENDPKYYDKAVSHWVMLRSRLQPLRQKPPEYYEVMYNVAACLVREAEKSPDKPTTLDRAKKAEQVLKAALVLSPRLNGPDTVARYRVLLDRAIALQGRSPEQKESKKP
jgi:cellulose synthase operon protein C